MGNIRFTIITVCFNAENYIEKTIKSVMTQDFENFEYIIKDGNSTDSTLNKINDMVNQNTKVTLMSNSDEGIYDAMNEAMKHAKGEYIYFLNAGDYFCNNMVLSKVDDFICNENADIVYGNIFQVQGEKRQIYKYGRIYKKKIFYLTGCCICHQSMFAKRELFERKFDLQYKVCADREWQLFWLEQKAVFEPMYFEVAEVLVEGFSKTHLNEFEREVYKCICSYFKSLAWVYSLIIALKQNTVFLKIIHRLENALFKNTKK